MIKIGTSLIRGPVLAIMALYVCMVVAPQVQAQPAPNPIVETGTTDQVGCYYGDVNGIYAECGSCNPSDLTICYNTYLGCLGSSPDINVCHLATASPTPTPVTTASTPPDLTPTALPSAAPTPVPSATPTTTPSGNCAYGSGQYTVICASCSPSDLEACFNKYCVTNPNSGCAPIPTPSPTPTATPTPTPGNSVSATFNACLVTQNQAGGYTSANGLFDGIDIIVSPATASYTVTGCWFDGYGCQGGCTEPLPALHRSGESISFADHYDPETGNMPFPGSAQWAISIPGQPSLSSGCVNYTGNEPICAFH